MCGGTTHKRLVSLFVHSVQQFVFDVDCLPRASRTHKDNRSAVRDHHIQQVGVTGGEREGVLIEVS